MCILAIRIEPQTGVADLWEIIVPGVVVEPGAIEPQPLVLKVAQDHESHDHCCGTVDSKKNGNENEQILRMNSNKELIKANVNSEQSAYIVDYIYLLLMSIKQRACVPSTSLYQ